MLGEIIGTIKKWGRVGIGSALLGFIVLLVTAFAGCQGQITETMCLVCSLISAALIIGGGGLFGMAHRLEFKVELERICKCGHRSRPGSKSCESCGLKKLSLENIDIGVS